MKLQIKSVCPDVHSRQSAVAAAAIFLMCGVRKKAACFLCRQLSSYLKFYCETHSTVILYGCKRVRNQQGF